MRKQPLVSRSEIAAPVISSFRDVLSQKSGRSTDDIGEDTNLMGQDAALDSMGIVTLIIDLDKVVEEGHEIPPDWQRR